MIRVIGRRADGVVLVDIGARQAYAVDMNSRRVSKMGDIEGALARGPEWQQVPQNEASQMRWKIQRVMDGPTRLVDYQYLQVFQEQKQGPLDPWAQQQPQAQQPPQTPQAVQPQAPQPPMQPVTPQPPPPQPSAVPMMPNQAAQPQPQAPPGSIHARGLVFGK